MKRFAFLFPGQGAQYIGMGKEFYSSFQSAKKLFDEADDLLKMKLSHLIFSGDEKELTQTKNSQPAIFVTSLAHLLVLQEHFCITPVACAGLSLGEYSALVAAGKMRFSDALLLVQKRANFMHDACEAHAGSMAVVLGLDDALVQSTVDALNMPQHIWAANFNCPGQVVISGTAVGLEKATKALTEAGAKRILPLQVHGAFHSGLMKPAQERLQDSIMQTPLQDSACSIAMNCTGAFCTSPDEIRFNLVEQVVRPVFWHKSIHAMTEQGIDLFLEIGPGKTLCGMNKRIGVRATSMSLEKPEDLKEIEQALS